jgi:hypothetical protein
MPLLVLHGRGRLATDAYGVGDDVGDHIYDADDDGDADVDPADADRPIEAAAGRGAPCPASFMTIYGV